MPRVTTTNLGLGTWLDGENPGAGSQTVLAGNTGLNANWLTLDLAVGTEHLSNGVHKSNVIDGPNLKTTAADGSTLELSGSPLKLRVKALGVTSAQLAAASVIAGKIAAGGVSASNQFAALVVDAAALASNAVTTAKILDANVTTAKIADHNVTTTKLDYREYVAHLVQAGGAAPSATALINTLVHGVPTYGRTIAGLYTITLTGEWTANKTLILICPSGSTWAHVAAVRLNDNEIDLTARDPAGALTDGWEVDILIRVYP